MNKLYKFIYISLLILISFVYFLLYNQLPKKTINEFHEPNISDDNRTTVEFNILSDYESRRDFFTLHQLSNIKNLTQDEWILVWQDEFESNYLDTDNWNIENWAAEKNNELQYYSPNNVKVEDGLLKLISKNEKFKGKDYTSGAVYTKGKISFLYGKVEMRAKLPAGQGIFPAFWMMPDEEDTWLPEIDIMEMLGHAPNEIWMVSHWLDKKGTLKSDFNTYNGPDFSESFHTFSIEWTPDSITWFIDDIERFQSSRFIPSEKMYLYINTAIGGNWPKAPDHSTIFPITYEVEYIRVFKKNIE